MAITISAAYHAKLAQGAGGGWQPDAAQAHAIERLQALATALQNNPAEPPQGLWLYGLPGRGKSELLNLFLAAIPNIPHRRVHFHAFMEELHRRLNAMPPKAGTDYVGQLATDIAAEATLLGFDEFYLTNLPDAMLLGRLMQHLFHKGVVVVATSNWPLPELFQGGLNHDRFTPLLNLMERKLAPISLADGLDYRQQAEKNPWGHYIYTPLGESAEAQLQSWWGALSEGLASPPPHWLQAKHLGGQAVWLTFEQACRQNLGRTEYRELADTYHTIVLEGVPQLQPHEADAALRLATLIDILYDQKRYLIFSAAVPPSHICTSGAAAEVFARTASRLAELALKKL